MAQAGVAFGSLLLGIGLLEVGARLAVPEGYYVWPPGFERTFEPDPEFVPGIHGVSRFTINSWGVRGDPFEEGQRYRILALGGSTTICTYLDDTETWPWLLQRRLEREVGAGAVWVGNVGRPGHAVWQNTTQLEKLVPQYPRIDAVLVLAGVNDLLFDLAKKGKTAGSEPRAGARSSRPLRMHTFSLVPAAEAGTGWLEQTGVGRMWAAATWRVEEWRAGGAVQDRTGAAMEERRELRRRARGFRDDPLEDLAALKAFGRRVERLVRTAQGVGVRLLLLTQPTLWREGLSERERSLLWTGPVAMVQDEDGPLYF